MDPERDPDLQPLTDADDPADWERVAQSDDYGVANLVLYPGDYLVPHGNGFGLLDADDTHIAHIALDAICQRITGIKWFGERVLPLRTVPNPYPVPHTFGSTGTGTSTNPPSTYTGDPPVPVPAPATSLGDRPVVTITHDHDHDHLGDGFTTRSYDHAHTHEHTGPGTYWFPDHQRDPHEHEHDDRDAGVVDPWR
jgi:hypothetical protein